MVKRKKRRTYRRRKRKENPIKSRNRKENQEREKVTQIWGRRVESSEDNSIVSYKSMLSTYEALPGGEFNDSDALCMYCHQKWLTDRRSEQWVICFLYNDCTHVASSIRFVPYNWNKFLFISSSLKN